MSKTFDGKYKKILIQPNLDNLSKSNEKYNKNTNSNINYKKEELYPDKKM